MERLTHKARYQAGYKANRNVHDWECIDKLGQLEDAEEQGLILRLPCKVGDYAWDLIMRYRFEIVSIEIRSCGTIIFRCGNKGTEDYASFSLEDIGETWMLTEPKETDYWLPNKKAEAEQALKHTENAR